MPVSTTSCKGCDLTITAEDEEQLVSAVQGHVTEAHGHAPTREQVLAVIRRREDAGPPPPDGP